MEETKKKKIQNIFKEFGFLYWFRKKKRCVGGSRIDENLWKCARNWLNMFYQQEKKNCFLVTVLYIFVEEMRSTLFGMLQLDL